MSEKSMEKKHEELLTAIFTITGKRPILERRTLLEKQATTVNFKGSSGRIGLSDLVKSLKRSSSHGSLKNQLRLLKTRAKVVDPSLPKHRQLKIDRSVAYDATRKEVSKWTSIIDGNRKASQLKFPLEKSDVRIHNAVNVAKANLKARTPLEVEIEKLLASSCAGTNKAFKKLTAEEKRARSAMSLEEARQRHAELCKHRALVSYKTKKETRVKKIKSKRYRRLSRRERMKEAMKDVEKMKNADPDAYLEKMQAAENARVKERLTLKHRKSSKYAKKNLIFAKYDDSARQGIQEMLEKKQELKQPRLLLKEDSNDEEADADIENMNEDGNQLTNPWMKSGFSRKITNVQASSELIDDNCGRNMTESVVEKAGFLDSVRSFGDKNSDIDRIFTAFEKRNSKKEKSTVHVTLDCISEEEDESMEASDIDRNDVTSANGGTCSRHTTTHCDKDMTENVLEEVYVDPKSALRITNSLQSFEMPTIVEVEGSNCEDDAMDINEAFADDDVIDEFKEEKDEFINSKKLKDIDLSLPAWGEWGGAGLDMSRTKKRRFVIKAPPAEPRRDSKLGNVILNEKKDDAVAKHQINKLPFPFKSLEQLQDSIRMPVGRTWNPETAFKELTRPKIVTRLGTVIAPINKEETFKKQKSVFVGKKTPENL